MNRKILLSGLFLLPVIYAGAQASKALTMEQYQKAKTFLIKDLDNDSYVKFDNNTYVLERYEDRKPYFITGDDGMKKRIDLYSLSSKADGKPLGTMIYYTTEKGKLYTACLPGVAADGKVWEKYFEDIHAIDKEEKYFVLKLSYVLSKEYSFQQYKSTLKGKEIDRAEAGTYGTDICFPGDAQVTMATGETKLLTEIQPGDKIITMDPSTRQTAMVTVRQLTVHDAKNYAITHVVLIAATNKVNKKAHHVLLQVKELEATPNHPVMTKQGIKNIGAVPEGAVVLCRDEQTGHYVPFTVWQKTEKAQGIQQVYNIDASGGSTFFINGVMVMQK